MHVAVSVGAIAREEMIVAGRVRELLK